MRKFKLLFVMSVMSAALAVPAYAASVGGAQVHANMLNLRSAPTTAATVLTTAKKDSLVVVGDKSDAVWYKVVCRGFTGYMNADYLAFSENIEGDLGNGTISGTNAVLRVLPNIFSQSLGCCANGTTVSVLGVSGSWYKILYGTTVGYILSDYIALTPAANAAVPSSDAKLLGETQAQAAAVTAAGQKVVDDAMKYLGCPYVYGGTTPGGFDCSGFVQYVYKECGYSVERTAASIYSTNGAAIEKTALQPGDVVAFSSSSASIGHVGIYIGDGKFIHASNSNTGVIISPLDMDYWTKNYVGAKRIVTADLSASPEASAVPAAISAAKAVK